MKLQKFRWSRVYESTEEELVGFLQSRKLAPTHWAAEAFTEPTAHTPEQDTTVWCAEGSFSLKAGGQSFSMQPGDALSIKAGTSFEITPGISGYICYETAAYSSHHA